MPPFVHSGIVPDASTMPAVSVRRMGRFIEPTDTKGTDMNTVIPTGGEHDDAVRRSSDEGALTRLRRKAWAKACVLDARMRTLGEASDEGAVTAEYAVVLVAATGFAALLVTIMKSETVRKMLLDIVKKALTMGG